MRLGEAVRLDGDHIDWDEGVVMVWNSKFRKSRAVPLHPSSLDALRRYAQLRDRCFPRPSSPSFLVSTTGTRLDARVIHKLFPKLVHEAGLAQPAGRRPRLHDLRHRFAVSTLLGWYRAGFDVEARMPLLSTFLGHSNPENTYWYLSAVPELLSLASERLERAEGRRS